MLCWIWWASAWCCDFATSCCAYINWLQFSFDEYFISMRKTLKFGWCSTNCHYILFYIRRECVRVNAAVRCEFICQELKLGIRLLVGRCRALSWVWSRAKRLSTSSAILPSICTVSISHSPMTSARAVARQTASVVMAFVTALTDIAAQHVTDSSAGTTIRDSLVQKHAAILEYVSQIWSANATSDIMVGSRNPPRQYRSFKL